MVLGFTSAILWWSVLLVDEIEFPEKITDLLQVIAKLYHIVLDRVQIALSEIRTLVVVGIDCTINLAGCIIMLASNVGSKTGLVNPMTIQLVFVASLISLQQ
jgi:hypothetical protein